ncbi:MAG: hypothetical protein KGL39_21100 [Patescibacteria group bacterium]|nr:hypothetical protein [Patescibacteria group bacterium]
MEKEIAEEFEAKAQAEAAMFDDMPALVSCGTFGAVQWPQAQGSPRHEAAKET